MIQDRITQIALAKQTALSSPASSGAYQIGVNSGSVATAEVSEDALPITWASRTGEGFDRATVTPGSSFETLAMPRSLGLLLKAALGVEQVTPGTPNVHTFTQAVTAALPYLTIFARKSSEYYKVGDCAISELEITWEGTKAVVVKVTAMGCTYEFLAAPFTADYDERPQCDDGVFKGAGGTFTVNGAAAVVEGGSIKITNNIEPVFGSNSLTPADVFPAMQQVDVSLNVVPNNLQDFRKVITGQAAGTTIVPDPFFGTCVVKFLAKDVNTLTFNGNNVRWLTEFPDTNAEGGPVKITLEGSTSQACGGGEPYSFVLENDIATAY